MIKAQNGSYLLCAFAILHLPFLHVILSTLLLKLIQPSINKSIFIIILDKILKYSYNN